MFGRWDPVAAREGFMLAYAEGSRIGNFVCAWNTGHMKLGESHVGRLG